MTALSPAVEKPRLYDFEEGFGSVYGRYVRKHLCRRLVARHAIRSVLEAPCNAEAYFASPGTQSVVFAEAGCRVSLVHPDPVVVEKTRAFWSALGLGGVDVREHADLCHLPFDDDCFDLVWSFDHIPLADDPERLLAEMARVSGKLVMVIVPNALNVGYPVHALASAIQGRRSPWGARRWMALEPVARVVRGLGLEVVDTGLVDAPPWPGFDALRPVGQLVRRNAVSPARRPPPSDSAVERMLRRLTFIEYGPLPAAVKVYFAHQLYLIARKPGR